MTKLSTIANQRVVVSRSQISEWITQHAHAFDNKFDRIFQLQEKKQFLTGMPSFSTEDIEVGRKALSAVLGGIGYFYGEPRIGNALDSPPLPVQANSKEEQEANEAHFKGKWTSLLSLVDLSSIIGSINMQLLSHSYNLVVLCVTTR